MDKKQLQNEILEAEYDRAKWINVLQNWFAAKTEVRRIPETIIGTTQNWSKYVEDAVALGKIFTDDGAREVGIFEVMLTEKAWLERNRVALRNLLNKLYGELDGALIVFKQGDKWRFTYVSEIRERDENGEVKIIKTEPKRYTYFFGDGENCRTAAERFENLKGKRLTLNDLNEAFSVEKLGKDFFKTYKEHFEKFWKYLAQNEAYYRLLADREKDSEDKKTKPIRDFVKVLLGRMVFLQFLQKKGWMAVPAERDDWQGGDLKFNQSLFARCRDKAHFHSTTLRTLFFETLNRRRPNDSAPEILGENIKIPYLNGGLFENDVSATRDIDFPVEYFSRLFDFFEQYNFTIDESDQFDREVGIDPEMLGHIFENLLEENREKGAFYTPKEIVHYMCRQSLVKYLSTNLPDVEKGDIASLVRENYVSTAIQNAFQLANRINDLLKSVKVCDPAIGSGAFPMGMLREIFECRRLLYGFLKADAEKFDPAAIKKEIIQKNIYGVDLEPGAVDIARLRFWLALVVDEDAPQALPNLDYKIMQGNSLLEQFDDISLKFDKRKLSPDFVPETNLYGEIINPQPDLMDYFRTRQESGALDITKLEKDFFEIDNAAEKSRIREKIEKLEKLVIENEIQRREQEIKKQIQNKTSELQRMRDAFQNAAQKESVSNSRTAQDLEKLRQKLVEINKSKERLAGIRADNKPYFMWHLYYLDVFENGGFDIVIGNPPYIQLHKMREETDMLEKADFKTFNRMGDIYCLFYEQSFNLLKKGGAICFITSSQWMRAAYGKSLRKYLLQQNPLTIINLGPGVFASATVDTNIFIGKKENFKNELKGTSINGKDEFESLFESYFEPMSVDEYAWTITEQTQKIINETIQRKGKPLKDWKIKVNFGIKTGFNTAFLIDEKKFRELFKEDAKSAEIVKPLLRGRDIQRYKAEFNEQYLIAAFPSLNLDIEDYPAVKNYLESFQPRLDQTGETFINEEGKAEKTRKKTGNRWFETQDQIAYKNEFLAEKVIWKRIGSIMRFAYSDEEIYCLDSTCIATGEKIKYLTALLNSRVSLYQLFESAPKTGMGDMIISVQALEPLLVYYPTPEQENYFNILVDYLLFLYDKAKPAVNTDADNKTIGADFEEVINMMVYELYFEEHLKQKEIDVFRFFDFEDISKLKTDPEKAEAINAAYKRFHERDNPIRNRISVSESRSPEIIGYINQNTY